MCQVAVVVHLNLNFDRRAFGAVHAKSSVKAAYCTVSIVQLRNAWLQLYRARIREVQQ